MKITVIIAQSDLPAKRFIAVEEGKFFLYTELFQLCNESTVAMTNSAITMTNSTLVHKTDYFSVSSISAVMFEMT